MDWTQVLTIILSVFGLNVVFFLYLLTRIDTGFKEHQTKMEAGFKELKQEHHQTREELIWVKWRLDPNEHPLP